MAKFRKPSRKRGIFKRKKQGGSKFMVRGITKFGGASTIAPPPGLHVESIISRIMKALGSLR